ncbi:MAG TPA: F0F1 ATP synthase subunit A [Brevibacterium sp.]|nr:F0F1 ATP synthase subunit A [Brevibacterium sp.]
MAAAGVPANPFDALGDSIAHMIESLGPMSIAGEKAGEFERVEMFDASLTTYTLWFIIAAVLIVVLVMVFKKKQQEGGLVPRGRFVNAFEMMFEFVKNDIVDGAISHNGKKHLPFVATVFFFVFINNFLGLIPGFKAGTGVIAGTAAISIAVFLYFNYQGIKEKGIGKYILGLVPDGVPKAIWPVIWLIELVSLFLRPITQALRLFANMYAGHIMLGIFATLTELFVRSAIQHVQPLTSLPGIAWLLLLTVLYLLEILVAAIQAYVFALLTAVYIDSATSGH